MAGVRTSKQFALNLCRRHLYSDTLVDTLHKEPLELMVTIYNYPRLEEASSTQVLFLKSLN